MTRPILRAAVLGAACLIGSAGSAPTGGIERDVERLSHLSLRKRLDARGRVREAGRDAVPALLKALRGAPRDTYRRHAALYLLGEIGDPSASIPLINLASEERNPERQRFWALSSLAKIREERAVDLARSSLGSDSESIRGAALQILLVQPPARLVPILLQGIRSDDRRVRSSSVTGLRQIADERKGYDPDGDPSDRLQACKKWEEWWEEHKAFPPSPPQAPEMKEHRFDGCVVWTDRGEARAKRVGESVAILRASFARWFRTKEGGVETRVREFQRGDDFRRYGSLNQWGYPIVYQFFYSPFLHEVVTFDTGDPSSNERELIHEVFHDFYNRNTRTQLPWFNEGVAEHFETWVLEGGEMRPGPANEEWTVKARAAVAAAPKGFLSSLMLLDQPGFYFEGRSTHYAISWAWVDYLAGRDGGEDLRRVFRGLKKSWSREQILRRVFGKKKLARLEEDFRGSMAEEAAGNGGGS